MKSLTDKQIAIIAVLTATIISGAGPVFTKIALKTLSPEYFSFLRFLISSLILMPIFLKSGLKLDKETFKLVLISLLSSANILLFANGLKTTTATIGQLLYVLSPVVIFVISYFAIKEKVTIWKIIGIGLGILGTALIILLPVIQKGGEFSGDLRGNLTILAGVILFSLYMVLSKKLHAKFSPVQITTVFSLTTMSSMLALSLGQISNDAGILFSDKTILFAVLYVGGVATAIYYVLQQYAVKHGSPLVSSTMLFLQPFSVLIWAGLLLGEKLSSLLVVGGVLVLSGTYFILKSSNKKA